MGLLRHGLTVTSVLLLFLLANHLTEGWTLGREEGRLSPCYPLSSCSCRNIDGLIDLHPLAFNNRTPRFTVQDDSGYEYFWNPCYSFDEGDCKDVGLCGRSESGQFQALGKQERVLFVASTEFMVAFQYMRLLPNNDNITTYVIVRCDDSEEVKLTFKDKFSGDNTLIELELHSRYGCPQKNYTLPPQPPTTAPTTAISTSTLHSTTPVPKNGDRLVEELNILLAVLLATAVFFLVLAILFLVHLTRHLWRAETMTEATPLLKATMK